MPETKVAAHKHPSDREGKHKAKQKVEENSHNWGQGPQQCHMDGSQHKFCKYHGPLRHSTEECHIDIAHSKGLIYHECKDISHDRKKVHFRGISQYKAKLHDLLSKDKKDMNTIANVEITKALSCYKEKEKKSMNKFETLSILSGSNAGNSSNEYE
eukprot:5276776-Ditylum_brightwellii.AAC.1